MEPSTDVPPPPPARREVVVDTLHGVEVPDPYRWLEDSDDPEVAAWVEAQNRRTRAALDGRPERAALAERLHVLLEMGSVGGPRAVGGRLFYRRRSPGQQQPALCVREGATDRVLLDPNAAAESGTVALDWWEPGPAGRLLAFGYSDHGDEWSTLRVLDTASGALFAEAIPRTRYASVAWDADAGGFHYTRYPLPGEVPAGEENYGRKVYHHRLGRPYEEDPVVFGDGVDRFDMVSVQGSHEHDRLLFAVHHGWTRTDLHLDGRPLLVGLDALFEPEMVAGRLFVRTNLDAPRWRLAEVDAEGRLGDVLPEGPDVLDGFALARGHIVAAYLRDAASRLVVFAEGGGEREVALPDAFGTVTELTADPDRPEAFFVYSSFARPPAVFRLDLETGELSVVAAAAAPPADPARVEVRRLFATSRDGTRVPVFVVRRAGGPGASAPTALTGYGGFNIPLGPGYRPAVHAWIERGGVYALACLRGGAEYGEGWHRAGMGSHKQNVFDDFLAAAEFLCREGITEPARLGILGGSNGGLLVGAAMTQRPELFGAVACGVPLLDMLRYHRFLIGGLWIAEYGGADDPEAFRWLHAYSPYHRVVPGAAYPPLLLYTAASDTRVHPLHARKMAALLQAECRGGPVLLRTEFEAGHGAGKPVRKVVDLEADVWGFLAWRLGL